jgi:DNA-binding transcriptional regulator YdaS (Cro superfamily)
MTKHRYDAGLQAAIKAAGSMTDLAKAIGITPSAVSQWDRIPQERVLDVEFATSVPREVLRPDIYAAPRPRLKRQRTAAHV